jgi:hypothetical protein
LVDPAREAERLVGASATGGFIVALGLGAAYAIKASLAEAGTSAVLAV